MELGDSLQALESVSQGVGQVTKQGVDKLFKVVPLVGPDRYKVVEYLVVAGSMKLLFECRNTLTLSAAEANCVPNNVGRFRSRHGCTITQCTFLWQRDAHGTSKSTRVRHPKALNANRIERANLESASALYVPLLHFRRRRLLLQPTSVGLRPQKTSLRLLTKNEKKKKKKTN